MRLSRVAIGGVVALAAGFVLFGGQSAHALSGPSYFNGSTQTISDNPSVSRNDVLSGSVLEDGVRKGFAVEDGLPGRMDKTRVYDWLKKKYDDSSANSRDRIGVTFIVKTMIGISPGTSGSSVSKSLTQANWNELHRRLVANPNIRTDYVTADPNNYGNGRVSFYRGPNDGGGPGGHAFFATYNSDSRPLLIIEDTSNNTRYVLERYCANPIGGLSLPVYTPPTWEMEHGSAAKKTSGNSGTWSHYTTGYSTIEASNGDTVRFIHRVRNVGSTSVNRTPYVQQFTTSNPGAYFDSNESDMSTSSSPSNWNPTGTELSGSALSFGANSGWNYFWSGKSGQTNSASMTVAITNQPVGQYLCQRVATWWKTSQPEVWRFSAPACAKIVIAPWNVTGTSARTVNGASSGTAAPGQVVRWTHTLSLNGGTNTSTILSNTGITGFSNGWDATHFGPITTPIGQPAGTIRTITSSDANRTLHTVTQDDVGNTLCQQLQWAPTSGTVGTTTISTPACVNVPYDYRLTPTASLGSISRLVEGQTVLTGGERPTVSIGWQGPTKSGTPVHYGVSQFVLRSGQSLTRDTAGDSPWATLPSNWNTSNTCLFPYLVATTATDCAIVYTHTSTSDIRATVNLNTLLPNSVNIPSNLAVGDKLCWVVYVSNFEAARAPHEFRHSAPICLSIGKSPKAQFWGSDVRSGGTVATSSVTIDGKMYGSWAEYAIRTSGQVVSASGAGLSGDGRTGLGSAFDYNRLTLGNTATPYGYGALVPSSDVPGSFKNTAGASISGSFSVSDISGEHYSTSNLTITGGEIPVNGRVIIKTTGTVTISGNITYANGPYNGTTSKVPQLVIYANNIIINGDVAEVNAWLIANRTAGSYVSTCGTVGSPTTWLDGLNSRADNACNRPLEVNGPITASHLYLRRTHGSEAASRNVPAEVLNLRPDTYIWAQSEAQKSGSISTQYIRELPPRF